MRTEEERAAAQEPILEEGSGREQVRSPTSCALTFPADDVSLKSEASQRWLKDTRAQ